MCRNYGNTLVSGFLKRLDLRDELNDSGKERYAVLEPGVEESRRSDAGASVMITQKYDFQRLLAWEIYPQNPKTENSAGDSPIDRPFTCAASSRSSS